MIKWEPRTFFFAAMAVLGVVAVAAMASAEPSVEGRKISSQYACDTVHIDRVHEITNAYRTNMDTAREMIKRFSVETAGGCGFLKPGKATIGQVLIVASDVEGDVFFWFHPRNLRTDNIHHEVLLLGWQKHMVDDRT